MPNVSFSLDTTGQDPANLISNELHTVTSVNANTYRLLIPKFAPFYLDNFELVHTDSQGNVKILDEGVDFIHVLPYLAGSRSIAKMLYGAVSLTDELIDGSLSMTYQILGGDWIGDRTHVLEQFINYLYNPILVTWDQVTNVQDLFPPINHDVSTEQLYSHEDLINAMNQIRDAIITGPQLTPSLIQALTGTQVNEGISRAEMLYYSKIK